MKVFIFKKMLLPRLVITAWYMAVIIAAFNLGIMFPATLDMFPATMEWVAGLTIVIFTIAIAVPMVLLIRREQRLLGE